MSGAFVLDSVCCGYGGRDILSGFSASVERGALTALIGPNGSGKSTLLKLLGGVVGYRGSAELEGRELRSMSRAEFGRAVGFVPQQTKISSPFTVYEVIAMGRLPYCGLFSKFNAEDDAAVLDAAGRAGVSHLLFRRASELSGGEQQRVYIARAGPRYIPARRADLGARSEPVRADFFHSPRACGARQNRRRRGARPERRDTLLRPLHRVARRRARLAGRGLGARRKSARPALRHRI